MSELKKDAAGVEGVEPNDINERAAVTAPIVPAQTHPLAELLRTGKVVPATIFGPAPRPAGPVHIDDEAGALLRDMRDDERY